MDIKEISKMLIKADIQNFPIKIELSKIEVNQLISSLIVNSMGSLPESIQSKIHFEKLLTTYFHENCIELDVRFTLTPHQLLLPSESTVDMKIIGEWKLEEGHIQIDSLQFNHEIVSKGIVQKILDWTTSKALSIKEESFEEQIISKINPKLKYLIFLLPQIQQLSETIDYVDYEIKKLQFLEKDENLISDLVFSIYINKTKESKEHQFIHLGFAKEDVITLLKNIVEENPPDVPKVELDILDFDIPEENRLLIEIKVKYGIVSMTADVGMQIHLNRDLQNIHLEVIDIIPKANFLVKKSFSVIKDEIIAKIEEKSTFSVDEIMKLIPQKFYLQPIDREINLELSNFTLIDLKLTPNEDILHTWLAYEVEEILVK